MRSSGPITPADRKAIHDFADLLRAIGPGGSFDDRAPWKRYSIRLAVWRYERRNAR